MLELIYVGHSQGDYEGTEYDNLLLSNGIATLKFKNKSGIKSFAHFTSEKTRVNVSIDLAPAGSKDNTATARIIKIEEKK